MDRRVVPWLRATLVALFLGALLTQALIVPIGASQALREYYSEVAAIAVPYAAAAILALACVEVALVAVWRLLSMVIGREIFSSDALKWVDVITVCAGIAAALAAAVSVHMGVVVQIGAILPFGLAGFATVATAVGLLMIVLRGLLTKESADRAELSKVI